MTPQERIWLGQLRREMDRLKAEVVSIRKRNQVSQESRPSMYSNQHEGNAMSGIVGNEVSLPSVQQRVIIPITISGEGSFIATGIHFAHKLHYQSFDSWSDIYLLDFTWGYNINSSGRERQNIGVPQPIVYDAENGYGFMPLLPQDVFPRGSTVLVWLEPEYPFSSSDRIWAGFSGYYLLEN